MEKSEEGRRSKRKKGCSKKKEIEKKRRKVQVISRCLRVSWWLGGSELLSARGNKNRLEGSAQFRLTTYKQGRA
jgi:hypothetical protein